MLLVGSGLCVKLGHLFLSATARGFVLALHSDSSPVSFASCVLFRLSDTTHGRRRFGSLHDKNGVYLTICMSIISLGNSKLDVHNPLPVLMDFGEKRSQGRRDAQHPRKREFVPACYPL